MQSTEAGLSITVCTSQSTAQIPRGVHCVCQNTKPSGAYCVCEEHLSSLLSHIPCRQTIEATKPLEIYLDKQKFLLSGRKHHYNWVHHH